MVVVRRIADAPSGADATSGASLAFEHVYEEYFAFVWRTLRRLGVRPENLADAAQDVFVVVNRRLADVHTVSLVRSFIYGIVVRVAHEHRRSQRRSLLAVEEPPPVADEAATSAHDAAVRAEEVELLDRLLATLEPEKREVLVLVELEQLSVPEVAELIGRNVNTVYTRLRAARAAFEQALARHRAQLRSQP